MSRTIAVIAPHMDDEVLGVGGTIARLAGEGDRVHVVTVTRGRPPLFAEEAEVQCQREAEEAHRRLGVHASHWLRLPAAELDTIPNRVVNEALGAKNADVDPVELYIPFVGDIHGDHQRVFAAALVAVRPHGRRAPAAVYAYETLSETNWNAPYVTPTFHPNHFVVISAQLEAKLDALRCFASQMQLFPHEHSLDAMRALATLRGATVRVPAAEAFVVIRTVAHARRSGALARGAAADRCTAAPVADGRPTLRLFRVRPLGGSGRRSRRCAEFGTRREGPREGERSAPRAGPYAGSGGHTDGVQTAAPRVSLRGGSTCER